MKYRYINIMEQLVIKVAFVGVHNSCRSQIAEAISKNIAGDIFKSYSAGTEIKSELNQDAVRLIKKIYGIDMEKHNNLNCCLIYHLWT